MRDTIQNIKNEALAQIMQADSADDLERLKISYLGRNGKLTKQIREISKLDVIERKKTGIIINEAKNTILNSITELKNELKENIREWHDPTIPGKKPDQGHLHIMTGVIQEITEIFEHIGFSRMRYPEVDWEWYAFTALNFPTNSPARDEMETFFVDSKPNKTKGRMLLTPHTSNGQVREMERVNSKPPIRMLNISRTYRRESDASHAPTFHQFEGLVVDERINITHLKGTLDYFAKTFFGPDSKTRIRPHNFKFTEPSIEIDITCTICGGTGCKLCKGGWLELGGAGMVHPNVLKAGGIDSKKYTGFAFGWGVERVLMMKPGLKIPDLRILYGTDLRYLRQY